MDSPAERLNLAELLGAVLLVQTRISQAATCKQHTERAVSAMNRLSYVARTLTGGNNHKFDMKG